MLHTSNTLLKQGTYRGRLTSKKGEVLKVEIRLDLNTSTISADFFSLSDSYYCSMRANLLHRDREWAVISPQFIFEQQPESQLGGRIQLNIDKEQEIQIICLIPDNIPEEYSGILLFESEFFRTLNIEIDKLEGYPWPPEFSTDIIPDGEQPEAIRQQHLFISLRNVFLRAGIEAHVHLNQELPSIIGQRTHRPGEGEDVRWDERELHEMMETYYSRQKFEAREWWMYLLILSRFDGGVVTSPTGQITNKGDSTRGIMFDETPGNIGSIANTRARQGAAVFWQTILQDRPNAEQWYKDRLLLRTIVHELGHVLNLPHPSLNNRFNSISFMETGGWKAFRYEFDLEELFHLHHGFYNEVVPGGNLAFQQWTSSSILRSIPNGGQANFSLSIQPTRQNFRFTEPVTVEVSIENRCPHKIFTCNLSPAYGDLRFFIRRPDGVIEEYRTPVRKCSVSAEILETKKTHLTSLTINANRFTFDTPGRYEIIATMPDVTNHAIAIAPPVTVMIETPDKDEAKIAELIFNRDASLFLYMDGGNHLQTAKDAFWQVVEQYPTHPTAAYAHLILGLNELAGQKRIAQPPDISKPENAATHLKAALQTQRLSKICQKRLQKTIKLCNDCS